MTYAFSSVTHNSSHTSITSNTHMSNNFGGAEEGAKCPTLFSDSRRLKHTHLFIFQEKVIVNLLILFGRSGDLQRHPKRRIKFHSSVGFVSDTINYVKSKPTSKAPNHRNTCFDGSLICIEVEISFEIVQKSCFMHQNEGLHEVTGITIIWPNAADS